LVMKRQGDISPVDSERRRSVFGNTEKRGDRSKEIKGHSRAEGDRSASDVNKAQQHIFLRWSAVNASTRYKSKKKKAADRWNRRFYQFNGNEEAKGATGGMEKRPEFPWGVG